MTTLTFDKLAYLEKLKASGIPEAQAEALDEALRETVATSSDIQGIRSDLEILKHDVTIRFGDMIMALGGEFDRH